MFDIKPLGAFVKYTLLPFLNQLEKLVNRIEHSNINTDKITRAVLFLYVFHTLAWCVTYVVIAVILGVCIYISLT